MKKIYLIYAKIPTLLFDSKMHEFVYNSSRYKLSNNYYIGLYAWTTNKILLDAFINFRKGARDMYNIVIKNKNEFTKEEFQFFKKDNIHEELRYYRIPTKLGWDEDDFNIGYVPNKHDSIHEKKEFFMNNTNYSQIVCTRYEYEELFEHAQQNFFDYMNQVVTADYIVLKEEYQLMLDKIGYCDIFNEIYDGLDTGEPDPFYSDRHDSTYFNRSYNLSYHGHQYFDIYANKVALFVNTFYEMIAGYKNGDEIKVLVYR